MKRNLFIISVIFILSLTFCSVTVYAQRIIPNLVGHWEITGETMAYHDIFHLNQEPEFNEDAGILLDITVQEGRTFAGYLIIGEDDIALITGAIDGVNITMQSYGNNNRNFFTCRLLGRKNPRKFIGTANSFEEVTLAGTPGISTSYIEGKKIR